MQTEPTEIPLRMRGRRATETYSWCALCERVYPEREWRRSEGRCPGKECGAPEGLKIRWEGVRQAHPDYPELPETDRVYSMHHYRL